MYISSWCSREFRCVCIHIKKRTCVCIYIHMYVCVSMYICAYICTYILYIIYIYIYIYICICMHVHIELMFANFYQFELDKNPTIVSLRFLHAKAMHSLTIHVHSHTNHIHSLTIHMHIHTIHIHIFYQFEVEKNPTIVSFPIKNLDLRDFLIMPEGIDPATMTTRYDLVCMYKYICIYVYI